MSKDECCQARVPWPAWSRAHACICVQVCVHLCLYVFVWVCGCGCGCGRGERATDACPGHRWRRPSRPPSWPTAASHPSRRLPFKRRAVVHLRAHGPAVPPHPSYPNSGAPPPAPRGGCGRPAGAAASRRRSVPGAGMRVRPSGDPEVSLRRRGRAGGRRSGIRSIEVLIENNEWGSLSTGCIMFPPQCDRPSNPI